MAGGRRAALAVPSSAEAVSVSVTPETPKNSQNIALTSFLLPLGQSLDFTAIAVDNDPPTQGTSDPCTINGPVWTAATQVAPADEGGASVTTTTEGVTTPANGIRITVHAEFSQPGVWTLGVQATATYTDTCNNTYQGTGTLSYLVTVVSVQMTPNPVYVGVGGDLSLTPDVEPPDASPQVSFQIAIPQWLRLRERLRI